MITPDWPAPEHIKSACSTRQGGVSLAPFDSLNVAEHVGDKTQFVQQNRQQLSSLSKQPSPALWLKQTHSTIVIDASHWHDNIEADAIISSHSHQVCTIMTADCLPVLLCDKQGRNVAAIHAGWRGLADGIIEKTLAKLNCLPQDIVVWLGPAIGPQQFEVGEDVVNIFLNHSDKAKHAFQQIDEKQYLADIYLLAQQRLNALGIHAIYGGSYCTVSQAELFFSYRRDNICGRMASMIWIEPK